MSSNVRFPTQCRNPSPHEFSAQAIPRQRKGAQRPILELKNGPLLNAAENEWFAAEKSRIANFATSTSDTPPKPIHAGEGERVGPAANNGLCPPALPPRQIRGRLRHVHLEG